MSKEKAFCIHLDVKTSLGKAFLKGTLRRWLTALGAKVGAVDVDLMDSEPDPEGRD